MNKTLASQINSRAKRCGLLIKAMALLAVMLMSLNLQAQVLKPPTKAPARKQPPPKDELADSRAEFVRLTKEYKASLEQLLTFYEADARKAEAQLSKLKTLSAEGLISRRDVETAERALADAQAKVNEARGQLSKADEQIAETLIETQTDEQMKRDGALAQAKIAQSKGSLLRTTTYTRYYGAGGWSLAGAAKVQLFFAQRFGRALPVSAFGQSALHDRWGLDHHNAMDVGINPDSNEGQALMSYLRANGIPFMAFRNAIAGVATGPHIHVGLPSHRVIR
jgi:hypothetical protein